jgi:hypothetical protein
MSYMCHICRHIYEHICTLGNICALICTYTSVHVCNIYAPLHICVHIFTLICAYMWAQYKYHIWHLTYMVHICQYYMQHICQMPYMLLILSTHMCMYEDIYVHNIRNIYGISHICCIYASTTRGIYVKWHICGHNISIIYDIWHTWYIYVSSICSIYAKCHICYLYCPLTCACMRTYMCTLHNIRNIKHIWHFAYLVHICQYYMGNICQMTYILLILRIYMCIYVCIDVTSISDIYGIWHIRCIYVSTMCDIYIKWHISYLYCALICACMHAYMCPILETHMTFDIYGAYM